MNLRDNRTMRNTFFSILLALATIPFSNANPTEPSVSERICDGKIDYFKRSCKDSQTHFKEPKFLKKGVFTKCSDIEKTVVTYQSVASSDSPLGAHKLCTVEEYRIIPDFLKTPNPSALQKRTEHYYDYGNKVAQEVVIEDDREKVIRITEAKQYVECRTPIKSPDDISQRKCSIDYSDNNRKVFTTPVQPLLEEDFKKLRQGESVQSVVQSLNVQKQTQTTELKPAAKKVEH